MIYTAWICSFNIVLAGKGVPAEASAMDSNNIGHLVIL